MRHIARIEAKYASYLRGVIKDALKEIEDGRVPKFMIDDHQEGHVVVVVADSVGHRLVTPQRVA